MTKLFVSTGNSQNNNREGKLLLYFQSYFFVLFVLFALV